ncbi:MAG: TetR/AcrR family transcriptional regulator [Pseudomonadota bacterium]
MVSKDIQRARALEKIAAHVLANGLAKTSLRQLAAAAGISDRMLLYYFKDKADVMASALVLLLSELQGTLNAALPDTGKQAPSELFSAALELVRGETMRPYMALWLEIAAQSARGDGLARMLGNQIVTGFQAWFAARLDIADPERRDEVAAALLVAVDGASLVDFASDAQATDLAAGTLAAMLTRIETGPPRSS